MSLKEKLFNSSEEEYGENYKPHYLEIYKTNLDMADRISSRRQSANSFFLSINTAAGGFVGYVHLGAEKLSSFYFFIGIAGMILCYTWYRLIRSYKNINSGKFRVVHEIERNLPMSPYDAEWEILGRGKKPKLYLPFTKVEMRVPWIFFSLHAFVFLTSFPWLKLFEWLRSLESS